MSTAKRIGGDWVENIDPSTGKKYYANLKTKVTSWHYPAELSGNDDDDGADVVWIERQDPKSGRIYYINPKTKVTSWTKPGKSVLSADSTKDDWVERQDPKTGKTYYYNRTTKMTTWKNPNRESSRSSTRSSSTRSSTKSTASAPQVEEEPDSSAKEYTPSKSRQSVKLGALGTKSVFGSSGDGGSEDRFAKLRALREKREGKAAADNSSPPIPAPSSKPIATSTIEEDEEEEEGGVDLSSMAEDLTSSIAYHNFEVYAKAHFNFKRKGFLGKQTTMQKILSWKKDVIRTSLHSLNDSSMTTDAVQIFKNIVSYMGDRDSSKKGANHCHKILSLTVHAPEELRDELFCQLVKQTRKNPNVNSCVRGWQLMAICAGTYPPSKKLEPYLLSYCDENASGVSAESSVKIYPEVQPYAKYALLRLRKSIVLGPRKEVPTELEINAAKERQPVVQKIHLLDRHYKTVPVEAWTTITELNAMVAKKLGIQDPTPFSTFEVSNKDEERVLDDDDRVLDVIAYWNREHGKAKTKDAAQKFTFVYKMRLFFDIPDTDQAAVDLVYMQAVHDVTDSRYPCSEQDCITLAALQVQEKFGDYNGTSVLTGNLHGYLPAKFLKGGREGELEDAINKVYVKLSGYTSNEAKQNYIDYVKSWKIYGSAYFFVKPQNSRDFPADVVLAVNAKGVLVVDLETKEFLAEHPYSEIVTWGHSAQTFVLVIGNLIRQNKLYFKTDQGAEMNALVHAYVNKLLDK